MSRSSLAIDPANRHLIELLSGISSGLASVNDLGSFAQEIGRALDQLCDAEYIALYLWDFDARRLRTFAGRGFSPAEVAEAERTAWDRHPGSVFREPRLLHVPDVLLDQDQQTQNSARSFVVRARLFMPVMCRDEVLGVIGLASGTPNRFTDGDIAVLGFISKLTGVVYRQLLDRTQRQRAESSLATTARRLQLVVDALPIALLSLDPGSRRISLAEGAGLRQLGLDPAACLGAVADHALAGFPGLRDAVQRAAVGDAMAEQLAMGERVISFQSAPHRGGELTVLLFDITDLRRALDELTLANSDLEQARDQALEATRAKSSFLAAMSHELRTPLNAIIGYTELLLEEHAELASPGFAADLERVASSARHLLGLISDVLDLSKIEAGKFALHPEDIDLGALLGSIDAACRPGQQRRGNRFVLDVPEPLPALHADATAVRGILINLLGNAHKFTQHGTVTLRIREHTEAGARRIVFVVEDTGIGMSEPQLRRIFDNFTQADASISRRFGGTGLGLAISLNFVQLMGGDISVTSAPGVGSAFTFWLPAGKS
ncbi:GAF domain-containing sensor histidine kinase [Nannocystis bainbridge]|uniref:histidine kinase n=1 Tax=Nannocystis bainbridge TaxID=2995303 RepID=A0ABT5ECZ6_9BACT|nr:ATP-binding protein [Nannocystis bainbridge]MDC0723435.1 ATP-binding protein [Nannocystis bainbridge]